MDTQDETPAQIVGNRRVEDAAIAHVIRYETRHGRPARDVRGKGSPGDVESVGRCIEVKATGGLARGVDIWMETRQVEEARCNPSFYVYVVDNIRQGDPDRFRLHILGGERLARLLTRAKMQQYYTVPWPVADYDTEGEPPMLSHPPAAGRIASHPR